MRRDGLSVGWAARRSPAAPAASAGAQGRPWGAWRAKARMDSERFFLNASAFHGFCWSTIVTVTLVYMVTAARLDPLQMVLVGTALEAAAFVFESPTGMLADAVSRRLSVIIGHAMTGLGVLVLALFPNFWMILLSRIVWGIGAAFISGAYAAWQKKLEIDPQTPGGEAKRKDLQRRALGDDT